MNQYVITLLSLKPCELNRFLSKFSDYRIKVEEGTFRWSCTFDNALASSLILSTLIDNYDEYSINAFLSINHHENIEVSVNNINDTIKLLYLLEEL